MKQILSVILGLLTFMSNGVSSCDVSALYDCISLFNINMEDSLLHSSLLHMGTAAIPTKGKLKQMCSKLSEAKACYQPKAALCEKYGIPHMGFDRFEEGIDYLCGEGYYGVLQHSSCWSQPRVVFDTKMCSIQYSQMLASQQDECQILDNTTSCMTDAVSRSCEPGAQCIMGIMMTRSRLDLASFMKCPVAAAPASCFTDLPGRSAGIHLTDRRLGTNTLLPMITILYTLSVL